MKVSALRLHLLLAPSLLFCTSSALASPQPGAAAGKSHTTSKQGEPDTGADVWHPGPIRMDIYSTLVVTIRHCGCSKGQQTIAVLWLRTFPMPTIPDGWHR